MPVRTPALLQIEQGLPSIRGRRSPNLKDAGYDRSVAACSDKVSAIFAKPGGSEIAAGPPLRQRGPAVRLASCERRIGALPPFTGTRVKAPLLPMADHHRRPMGQAGGENHTDPPSREPRPEHHR